MTRSVFVRPLVTGVAVSLLGAAVACSSNDAAEIDDPPPTDEAAAADAAPAEEAPAKSRVELAREALPAEFAAADALMTPEVRAAMKTLVEAEHDSAEAAIAAAVAGAHRKDEHRARDGFRHPTETLMFFGLTPESTVVEMGAGGGWYTEIIAPVVAQKGQLVIGTFDPATDPASMRSVYAARQQALLQRQPELYGNAKTFVLQDGPLQIGPPGSADLVVAIREMHNWQRGGNFDAYVASVFDVLKPGGTFGVVQHRAKEGTQGEDTADSGYLAQDWLIKKVTAAGFELEETSEINANAADTKDYKDGVWTLPPVLRLGDTDRAKYEAIGESDRMTLRFKKPS